jgi:hypothetical protein
MLRVFGFMVHCDHPHKLLISFVKVLEGDQVLIQEAWNVVNDRCAQALSRHGACLQMVHSEGKAAGQSDVKSSACLHMQSADSPLCSVQE